MQTAMEVYADSSYAYVADGSDGLKIVDVSNPYTPFESGSYNTGGLALAAFVKDNYAYLADGEDGFYIIRNDLITSVDDNKRVTVPENFLLLQNYPNPFNPTTKIEYSVPATGNVKLTVHNLIGEEVALLVNGQVEAGFYETTFDAFNLPSGMYLYKLQAGNLIEIKKMILVK
jgi:hypothetical protein